MIELISVILYVWLLFAVVKIFFRVAWGFTKIIAGVLFIISLPVLIGTVLLASSLVLLVPIGLLVLAALLLIGDL